MNYSGLANKNDFNDSIWKEIFVEMEQYQKNFLVNEKNFRSTQYKWPGDALHNWSRIWEYPYVYFHLSRFVTDQYKTKIVDIGSGVTYFTPYLAEKKFFISATDIDPITKTDLSKALNLMNIDEKSAEVTTCTADRLPYDDKTFDIAISISVIEHVEDYESTIKEIHRILNDNGKLILTLDIDLNGNHELKPERFITFMKIINRYFKVIVNEKTSHPLDVLTSLNSPYPYPVYKSAFHKLGKIIIRKVKDVLGIKYYKPFYLACMGLILEKN